MTSDDPLDAGDAAAWLAAIRAAVVDGAKSDVACGGCTACCRAAQFIEVHSDEEATLAAIPARLRFPAPGRPGSVVLGHDEVGRCPMLVDDRCSIYEVRPRACRSYDCRIFAATGIDPGEPVASRARRWGFTGDTAVFAELKAAAAGLEALAAGDATGSAPIGAPQRAAQAVRVHLRLTR